MNKFIFFLIIIFLYFIFFKIDKYIFSKYIENFEHGYAKPVDAKPANSVNEPTNVSFGPAMGPAMGPIPASSLENSGSGSLCSQYSSQPMVLNEKCGLLTEKNCNVTSCCVWLNGKTCTAGDSNGPIFRTSKGIPIEIKKYSFKDKLYKFTEKT